MTLLNPLFVHSFSPFPGGEFTSRHLLTWYFVVLISCLCPQPGYRSHDKKKKYDSSKSRLRKKMGGREKDGGSGNGRKGTNRGGGHRPSRSHSDEEEDDSVPASYHTVSLQVSQDVSTTALLTLLYLISYILTSIHLFILKRYTYILVLYIHFILLSGTRSFPKR